MVPLNRLTTLRHALLVGPYEKRWTYRGRPWKFSNRGPGNPWGRFGGGWETNVGVQVGARGRHGTIIINLGRSSIRIDPAPKGGRP